MSEVEEIKMSEVKLYGAKSSMFWNWNSSPYADCWLHRPWVVSKYLVPKFGIAYLIKGSQEPSKSKPFQNKLSEEVFYIIMV